MNESGGETTTPGWIADRPEVAGCVETRRRGGSFAAERDSGEGRAMAKTSHRRGDDEERGETVARGDCEGFGGSRARGVTRRRRFARR